MHCRKISYTWKYHELRQIICTSNFWPILLPVYTGSWAVCRTSYLVRPEIVVSPAHAKNAILWRRSDPVKLGTPPTLWAYVKNNVANNPFQLGGPRLMTIPRQPNFMQTMRSQNCLARRHIYSEEKGGHQKLMAEKKAKWSCSCRVPTTILLVPRRHVSRAHLVKLFALDGTSSILPRREPFFTLYPRRGGEANGKTGDFSSPRTSPANSHPRRPLALRFVTKQNALV